MIGKPFMDWRGKSGAILERRRREFFLSKPRERKRSGK
jgi:hypothetical protein